MARHTTLLFLTGLFLSSSSLAQPWQLPEFNGLISGAVSSDELPYQQVSTTQQPSLLVFGRLGEVFIEGNRAGTLVKRFEFGALSLIGQLRTHQYLDASETNLTNKDRDKSIELGPQLSIPLGSGFVSQFSVLQDVSGKHEGQEYEAAIYKRFRFDDLTVLATLAAQYQNDELVDYYVGTSNYQGKAELTQEVELLGTYNFNDEWSAVAVWRYYQHGSEIKNSPLTNDDHTQRIALGVGYRF
jgi:outer membrane scaffolding protein for murein synthesis (MipA/OmpV family)